MLKKLNVKIRSLSEANTGKKASNKTRENMSKAVKKRYQNGERSHSYKGGILHKPEGYILREDKNHPLVTGSGYVREHRLVMEKHIGRYLTKEEVVHHINDDKADNSITNLRLFTSNSEHTRYHQHAYKFLVENNLEEKYYEWFKQ
jgi:hypothetical protein